MVWDGLLKVVYHTSRMFNVCSWGLLTLCTLRCNTLPALYIASQTEQGPADGY